MSRGKTAYGFAVIGCGAISHYHIHAIQALEDARLVGVYDESETAAEKTAAACHVRCYKSREDVFSDPSVDAVCICTPSFLHAPLARQAMLSGKSVLVEKPLAFSVQECDELIQIAKESRVLLGVVSQLRFSSEIMRVKQAVDSGALGRITRADLYMKYYRNPEYFSQSPWRGTLEKEGGGALLNQGIHGVDLLRYIAGPVKTIYAMSRTLVHPVEVEDTLNASISFTSGTLGVIEASTADWPGSPRRIELNGESGNIILEENKIVRWEIKGDENRIIQKEKDSEESSWCDPARIDPQGHILQMQNFVSALRGDSKLLIDASEAKKTLQLIFGIYQSAATGKAVELEPEAIG